MKRQIAFALVFSFACACTRAGALTDGLVLCYHFDSPETLLRDAGPHEYALEQCWKNASFDVDRAKGPVVCRPGEAKFGAGAAYFSEHVFLRARKGYPAAGPVGRAPHTFAFFFKCEPGNRDDRGLYFFGTPEDGHASGLSFRFKRKGMMTYFWGQFTNERFIRPASPEPFNDGAWHSCVQTWDGRLYRIYLDGLEVDTDPADAARTTRTKQTGPDLRPGEFYVGAGHNTMFHSGWMDEVALWNRALSTEEIAAYLAKGVPTDVFEQARAERRRAWAAHAPVTLESLLSEMTDLEAPTRLPEVPYTTRLWSSYDRATVSPDRPGWFANDDRSHFLREERMEGRREMVMAETEGPGAITRFWVTVANTDGSGILRIYVDGAKVIEGKVLEVLSGGRLCGAPLSDSVSPKTAYLHRGHDLYLPIPYGKSLKVTYESASLWPVEKDGRKPPQENFYYNLETRSYPDGMRVESFTPELLAKLRAKIEATNARLREGPAAASGSAVSFDGEIAAGASMARTFTGPSAIRELSLNVGREPAALRGVWIRLAFDGEETVFAPVGDFMGVGRTFAPCRTWYTRAETNGVLTGRWTMPFAKTCTATLVNLSTRAVKVAGRAVVSPYAWDAARSCHFGASFANNRNVWIDPWNPRDVNYADLKGQGRIVGTAVCLYDSSEGWWGEGDEKVFIDGERTPSYIGTGSEDHYGYAWSNPNVFEHPMIAQPVGRGAWAADWVQNIRHRLLDAVVFTEAVRFDMELMPCNRVRRAGDYAPIAWWYMRPGGQKGKGAE